MTKIISLRCDSHSALISYFVQIRMYCRAKNFGPPLLYSNPTNNILNLNICFSRHYILFCFVSHHFDVSLFIRRTCARTRLNIYARLLLLMASVITNIMVKRSNINHPFGVAVAGLLSTLHLNIGGVNTNIPTLMYLADTYKGANFFNSLI